jgi:predicted metal-dependent hydrolase
MQFEFRFGRLVRQPSADDRLFIANRAVPLHFVGHRRARRYVLRLRPDGTARVTIPRGGSAAEARRFVQRNLAWLEQQLLRQTAQSRRPQIWQHGTEVLFRGELLPVQFDGSDPSGAIRLGTEIIQARVEQLDLRPAIEQYLWRLAARELPARVLELAAGHQLPVRRVTVRNQRSRWGSCSRGGTISLNWRLVQAPNFVRDYIVLHELAHLREMNHSRRFWAEVARLCPDFQNAEQWLKQHSDLLG